MRAVVGEARRRLFAALLRGLEERPRPRIALTGPDAEAFLDALAEAAAARHPVARASGMGARPHGPLRALARELAPALPVGPREALLAALGPGERPRRRRLHETLRAAFEACPRAVLIVPDLDRADAETRALLGALASDGAGPALLASASAGGALPAGVTPRPVPSLDADALRELLAHPETVARLAPRLPSVAAFARWSSAPAAPAEPELAPALRAEARLLALLGRADPRGVARALGRDPAALRHAWERCGARPAPDGFVLSGERADALAAEASPAERAEAASLAWTLGRPERAIPLWLEAGALDEARGHAEEAARLLVAEGAHGEAEHALVAVLEHADLPEADARRLRRVLAALLESAGELARAAAQATALVEAGDDDARPALARLRIATGEPLRAEAALEGAPATLEVGALRAELAYQRGALAEAETRAHALAAKAQAAGEAEAELTALQTHAKSQLDDMAGARRRFDRYAARARALGSARHEALALGGRGVAAIRARALDDAERDLRRAAALAEEADDPKGRALAWHNLAVVAHLRHRWGDAREAYEEALRWLRLLGHRASLARCAYNLGELYERLGALDRARAVARLGTEVGGGATLPPAARAEGWVLRGRVELQAGDATAAEAAFEEAAEHLGVLDPSRRAAVMLGRARAAMALGALDDAEALLDELPAELPDARQAEAALTRAELVHLRHGRLGRELPHAERALKAAERAGDPHLELEALVMLADALGAGGGAAAADTLWARARSLDAELAADVPDDLREAFAARPLRRRLERGRALGPAPRFGGIVGGSPALLDALEVAERVAPTTCTVLLRGESGTGKELVAEAIHRASPRRRGPLVRVNCAALVDTLLASELFGHEKGAFTGATTRRRGRFELAEGGTLFLDEIGDISPKMQAALLRVLQEKRIERVGGTESIDVDVRVIAATHRDLEERVAEGVFREDLYYRLDEVRVRLPPLREREGDVPLLARHFLARIAEERGEPIRRLTPEAVAKLEAHAWPGNVRQLENALKAASLFAASGAIEPGDLPLPAGPSKTPSGEPDDYARLRAGELTMKELKKELERRCIAQALEESAGNVTKAAELIGMTRPRLSQLAKAYGLRGDEKTGSQGGEA